MNQCSMVVHVVQIICGNALCTCTVFASPEQQSHMVVLSLCNCFTLAVLYRELRMGDNHFVISQLAFFSLAATSGFIIYNSFLLVEC